MVTLAAASTFQNGDGVVIFGAGAVQSMATPTAPTVTPSISRVGTGTGDVVSGPTGSTSYTYQVMWCDIGMGCTAASAATTITNGQASLGSQTVNITSMSRSGFTVTVTTAAPHTLTTGAMVYLAAGANGLSDNSFAGWYQVSGSADTTHFTFLSGMTTANGASTSATGGTVTWFNCNHIVLAAAPAAGYQAFIYKGTAPGTLVGYTLPFDPVSGQTRFGDRTLTFDDFGSPMMDNFTGPPWVPTTAPTTATNDALVTTISSGAGTTTLTLAANAGTTVSGATIKDDDNATWMNAAAAANGGMGMYVPSNVRPLFNSVVNQSSTSSNVKVVAPGGFTINGTWIVASPTVQGGPFSGANAGAAQQFGFEGYPSITCNGTPCIFWTNGRIGRLEGFQINGPANQGLNVLQDGNGGQPGPAYERINIQTGVGNGQDYMGVNFWCRGDSQAGCIAQFNRINANTGPNQTNGASATPNIYIDSVASGGYFVGDTLFLNRRGILMRGGSSGSSFVVKWLYEQGGITPLLTFTGDLSAGVAGMTANIFGASFLDTMAHPIVTYLPSVGSLNMSISANNVNGPSSGMPSLSGSKFVSAGGLSGQNTNLGSPVYSAVGIQETVGGAGTITGVSPYTSVATPAMGTLLFAPAAPTCVVASGGSTPTGAHTEAIAWVDALNNTSLRGPTCSVTTTTGNQTINVTPVSPPAGAVSYLVYRDGVLTGPGSGNCGPFSISTTFSDTLSFANPCTSTVQTTASAVGAGIGPNSMTAPAWLATANGFVNTVQPVSTMSANRATTLPDYGGVAAVASNAGTPGQVLISNGPTTPPSYQDPNVSHAPMVLLNAVSATATQTTASAVKISIQSSSGTLVVTGSGITGSPSGCSIVLELQQSTGAPASAAIFTQTFTPNNTYQSFVAVPSSGFSNGDNMIAVYNCTTTFPSAGTITVTFSPSYATGIATNSNPVSNAIAVNGGEIVYLNVSGSNVTNATIALSVRFRSQAGVLSTLSATNTTLTCSGVVMAQCAPVTFVAMPSSGWLEWIDAGPSTLALGTSQLSAQFFLGCQNLGLTGTGTTTLAIINTCNFSVQLANAALSTFQHMTWPTIGPHPTAFVPWLNTSTVANPAAGAQWSTTMSTVVRTNVVGITFVLTTNATVANRYAGIFVQCNSTNTWFSMQSSAAQVASTVVGYTFIPGIGPLSGSGGGTNVYLPLPTNGLEFSAGDACGGNTNIQSFVTGMQSGDQFSAIVLRSRVWEEGN